MNVALAFILIYGGAMAGGAGIVWLQHRLEARQRKIVRDWMEGKAHTSDTTGSDVQGMFPGSALQGGEK